MPLGLDQRVALIVWSPLGWGRLTGKLRRGQSLPPENRLRNDVTAQLDAASATPAPYPYWHQAGFAERNPAPV